MNNVLEQLKEVQAKLDKARLRKENIEKTAAKSIAKIDAGRLVLRQQRKDLMEILAR
jgi:hypothetical protein